MPAAARVIRHETDAGWWELVLREPGARLRGDVLALEDYAERAASPVRERHLPPPACGSARGGGEALLGGVVPVRAARWCAPGATRRGICLAAARRDGGGLRIGARLVRFNRALRFVERGLDDAEVAFRCGYTDQAHFVKEFRRFSGTTPAALALRTEVRFLQDVADRAA